MAAENKVMRCTCKHDWQDSVYGKGMRLWNPIGKGSSQGEDYRCTVCGATTKGSGAKAKKK